MALETDNRPSDSPYIARVWRGRTSGIECMMSVAIPNWELVVWRHRGLVHVAARGPETVGSVADVPDESESFGISFSLGTSMPHLPVQRRVTAATGLTKSAIQQIERARQAAMCLGEGVAALDVVNRLGYYDQPHLARSLKRFIGRTATQLRRGDAAQPLSLLYKTGA